MLMNLAGVAFAIAAIVLYTINLVYIGMWWLCREDDYYDSWDRHHDKTTATPSTEEKAMQEGYWERCVEGKELILVSVAHIWARPNEKVDFNAINSLSLFTPIVHGCQ